MWFSKRRIYLDYASATPLLPEAASEMHDAEGLVGNPGAIHAEAVEAKRTLQNSRERIAKVLGCKARELVFTSGLTEANNLAIIGFARKLERIQRTLSGTHWIVSAIEHASVLECFSEVERMGGEVTHVMPNEKGIVTPEGVASALRPQTVFVSVGWANNEIGVIQPLSKIARVINAHEKKNSSRVLFHTDGGQAPLYEPTVVHSLGADLVSLSASKLYGPHGIGALYLSNRADLAPVILGGDQERGLRAGTENAALAAGFAAAFEIVAEERHTEGKRLATLRDELSRQLVARIPGISHQRRPEACASAHAQRFHSLDRRRIPRALARSRRHCRLDQERLPRGRESVARHRSLGRGCVARGKHAAHFTWSQHEKRRHRPAFEGTFRPCGACYSAGMDIEKLTKSQIVLLTLLISFVTSIATGIVTVSLMQQAPPTVAETVNRIIEHTIEAATSTPRSQTATVVQQQTVVVNEADLVAQAVKAISPSIVRIYSDGSDQPQFLGLGVVVDASGTVAADIGALGDRADATVETESGTDVRSFVTSRDTSSGLLYLTPATSSDAVSVSDPRAACEERPLARAGRRRDLRRE